METNQEEEVTSPGTETETSTAEQTTPSGDEQIITLLAEIKQENRDHTQQMMEGIHLQFAVLIAVIVFIKYWTRKRG